MTEIKTTPLDQPIEELSEKLDNTRADFASSLEALTDTSDKTDVKAQASEKLHDAGEKLVGAATDLKEATPPQVQQGLDVAADKLAPLAMRGLATAKTYPKQTAAVVVGLLTLRKIRKIRKRRA